MSQRSVSALSMEISGAPTMRLQHLAEDDSDPASRLWTNATGFISTIPSQMKQTFILTEKLIKKMSGTGVTQIHTG